jgi:tetratricopeptide (TPR) repeat protein
MIRFAIAAVMAMAGLLWSAAAVASALPEGPGMQMLQTEDYAGAQAYFGAALERNPQDAAAAAGMATLELARERHRAGVDWARKAVALAPDDANFRMLLGLALGQYVREASLFRQLGIAHEVRDAFAEAVRLEPDNAQARASLAKYYILAPGIAGGSVEKADEQIAALDRLDAARAATVRATLAQQRKDAAQTEAQLRAAARLDPSGDSDYWLGMFYVERGRTTEAVAAFNGGIARNPDNSINYFGLGQAAVAGGTGLQQGMQGLRKFLQLPHGWLPGTPTYKQAHVELGKLYALAGDAASEKAQYLAALELDPDYAPAKAALASGPA